MKKTSKKRGGKILNNHLGFTLVEVLVSLLIISLLMVGLYNLIIMSLRITADNAYIVQATEIANQKMEIIRNMRYDDVGTLTGSPAGIIQEYETVQRNGLYDVHTMVTFYDDPYDGTLAAGTDNVFVDYKIATIDVNWQGKFGPKKISVFSKIIPNTQETLSGYGLLKLIIVDASGAAAPNAAIHIENASPLISADYVSNTAGQFDLALLPDFEGYEITVSKAGYATAKTYARDAVNLNPTKPNLSIFEGAKTEESFSIDRLANFTIRTVSNTLPDNWRINAATADENLAPIIGLDQNDNAYFAWQKNGSSNSAIQVQKYNSSNIKQWASQVEVSTTLFQTNPDIATTKSGLSYVVWQDSSVDLKLLAYDTTGHIKKIAKHQPPAKTQKIAVKRNAITALTAGIKSWLGSVWHSLLAFSRNEITTQPAQAVSNVAIVQTKISNIVSGNGNRSITASFNSVPAAGNVLIAMAVHSNASSAFSAPTNSAGTFTVSRYSNSAWQLDVGIWHKIAGASEPSPVTIQSSGDINGGVLMLMEVSGLDTASLLNVTASNDQTGNTSLIASTTQTTASASDAFAISAVAFADNDFTDPNNSSWSSGSANPWTQRLWQDWTDGADGSLAVATMVVNAAAKQGAILTLAGGGNEERNNVIAVFKALPINQASVSAAGNQVAGFVMPQTNYYLGGKFIITETNLSRDVNSVKLQEAGTVDAQTAISAVKLYYDLDTTAPYDCATEAYSPGTDLQFGASATFDGADGFATITHGGGINITATKTLCLYPVISLSGAANNQTLELRINNPSTDVVVSAGTVVPSSEIEITGSTILTAPADISQVHARLRKDDGNEIDATWKYAQDAVGLMYLSDKIRLRFEIANRGGTPSAPIAYRLEYGEPSPDCDSISAWQAVPNNSSFAWEMADSTYYADAAASTNVINGLTDENITFTPSQLKDADNQTVALILGSGEFTEMEYNIKPNVSAGDKTFCFRLTDQGDDSAITYEKYAVVSVNGDENIYIRAINSDGSFAWPIKKVNAEMSLTEQINPAIALIENLGVATTAVAWEDGRNGNADIYLQILDAAGNRKLATDRQVSASANNDYAPDTAFDSDGNLYVAWVSSAVSQDIYLSKFDQNENLLAGPIALKMSASQEYYPKIKFDGSDNLYLTHTQETSGLKRVAITKYDSTLTELWEKNPNLGGMSSSQYNGNLEIYGATMIMVWHDERNGDKDIYAQEIDGSGNPVWASDFKINIGLDTADQLVPEVVVRSNLKAISAWQDNRSGKNEVYAAEFSGPNALSGVANLPLEIIGTKRIGENPVIYKYNQVRQTDANGYLYLQLDWDVPGYSISIHSASSSKTIILRDPPQPLNLSPADNKTMIIYVQ